jgi:hypothetical protein
VNTIASATKEIHLHSCLGHINPLYAIRTVENACHEAIRFSYKGTATLQTIEVEVEVTLRLTVSQSVCLGIEQPCGTCDQILLPVGMLLSEICGFISVGSSLLVLPKLIFAFVIFVYDAAILNRVRFLVGFTSNGANSTKSDFPFLLFLF